MPRNLGFLETFPVLAALPTSSGSGRVVTLSTDGRPYFDHSTGWQRLDTQGDMLKSVYDATGTAGIVDNSEALGGILASKYVRNDVSTVYAPTLYLSANLDAGSSPTLATGSGTLVGWNRSGGDGEAVIVAGSAGSGATHLRLYRTSGTGSTTEKLRLSDTDLFIGNSLNAAWHAGNLPASGGHLTPAAVGGGTPGVTNFLRGDGNFSVVPFKDWEYNTDTLRLWNTALSNLDSGALTKYNLVVVGDSITEGIGIGISGTSIQDLGFVGRLRAELNARYDDVGSGFVHALYPRGFPLWTYVGTWTASGFGVTGNGQNSSAVSATASMSFNGTGVTVSVTRGGVTGLMEVKIDGVVVATTDTYNASIISNFNYSYTGLTDGPHTLVLRNVGSGSSGGTGAVALYLNGAAPIRGTRGVVVQNAGYFGSVAANHTGTDALLAEVDQFTPTLTVIALTANDSNAQTPLATYSANLQTIITRAKGFGEVLLASVGPQQSANAIPQSAYVDVMRQLAVTNNCSFLDIFARWRDGVYAATTLALTDGVHPNAKGHVDIATALVQAILPPATMGTVLRRMGVTTPVRTVTANYTVLLSDGTVFVDATAGPVTVTLPTAFSAILGVQGQRVRVKKIDTTANAVTITASGGQIDGAASAVISTPYNAFEFSPIPGTANWGGF